MGIEYFAGGRLIPTNHGVTGAEPRRVRFSCEKYCHTSQLQPLRQFAQSLRVGEASGQTIRAPCCSCAFHRLYPHLYAHQMVLLFMH
jgi:hypothetical protein